MNPYINSSECINTFALSQELQFKIFDYLPEGKAARLASVCTLWSEFYYNKCLENPDFCESRHRRQLKFIFAENRKHEKNRIDRLTRKEALKAQRIEQNTPNPLEYIPPIVGMAISTPFIIATSPFLLAGGIGGYFEGCRASYNREKGCRYAFIRYSIYGAAIGSMGSLPLFYVSYLKYDELKTRDHS